MKTLSSAAFKALHDANPALLIVDVRTRGEFSSWHLEGNVQNIPLDEIDAARLRAAAPAASGEIYLMCRSRNRALQAAQKLEREGVENLVVVEGGVPACEEAGCPMRKTQGGVWELERQVRFAAGALVLLGFVLGQLGAPAFYWLSGFVGAGLVFAGATGWCGMALLMAKAPWNRKD